MLLSRRPDNLFVIHTLTVGMFVKGDPTNMKEKRRQQAITPWSGSNGSDVAQALHIRKRAYNGNWAIGIVVAWLAIVWFTRRHLSP